jgi:simple sugar transport system ATP-binding protein
MSVTLPSAEAAPLLDLRGITKAFPGVRALDDVDFTLRAGEIHALLGENGAGKSTLINIITGALAPDRGAIEVAGRALALRDPANAEREGIAAVYQELSLLPNLTVAENIFLGRQPTRLGLVDRREMHIRAKRALAELGVELDVSRPLGTYSAAIQQLAAIARGIDQNARVLVLDEPTASLDANESARLFDVLRRLKGNGVGIVFVTHFLDQVFEIADRLSVLRNGRCVGTHAASGIGRLDLVALMLGREFKPDEPVERKRTERRALVARFANYGRRRTVAPFSLDLHAGEVVGAAGLLGSGRTESALLMFGALPADSGTALVDGEKVSIHNVRDAVRVGFAYCPENRKSDGIVGVLSIRENIILALQARKGWHRLDRKRQLEIAQRFVELLDIRTQDVDRPIEQLSGGNQQKALLARWLAIEPRLMILDEPTRGVDVGAHAELLRVIRRMCDEGMAIYLISSEIDELVASADRISIMRERHQVGMLEGADVNAAAIMGAIAEPEQRPA